MTITNHAVGESINLATVLNTKLEKPILQSEMGLDAQATATKQAIRWDEFSLKHNNDGSFKGIDQGDITLTSSATATQKPIRWDEFTVAHNSTGSLKGVDQADMKLTSAASATQKPVRYDEFTNKHNSDGTFKTGVITNTEVSSTAGIVATKLAIQSSYKKSNNVTPNATASTYGTSVTLTPPANFSAFFPQAVDVVFAGTFGTETATAKIVVTYKDTTTATVTKTATSASTVSFTNSDIMSMIKDGTYITQIVVSCMSSIASSTTNVTFNHCGFNL